MRAYGFSTGALAKGDFLRGVELQMGIGATAVEISALREQELEPTLQCLSRFDRTVFDYVSVHAPSKRQHYSEEGLIQRLRTLPEEWSIVVHPNVIQNYSLWRALGDRICVENMDGRKAGRTARELDVTFDRLPAAGFCLDLGHAHQVDPTMGVAIELMEWYGDRLRHIHISEVAADGSHSAMSFAARHAFSGVAHLIPDHIPVIIEAVVEVAQITSEFKAARRTVDGEQRAAVFSLPACRPSI